MNRPVHIAAAWLLVAALGANPLHAQSPDPTPAQPRLASDSATEPASNSAMDGELFYQLLLGELNAVVNEPGVAYSLLLDAARKTSDPRLYKRAVDIALQNRSGDSALVAARAWRQAIPTSREANRYLMQILLGINRVADALEPLKRELSLAGEQDRAAAIASIPRSFTRVSDKKMAISVVEQALAEYLNHPVLGIAAWTAVGRVRQEAGDITGALEAARRAQAIDATADGPAMIALALMEAKTPQAEALVRKYLAGRPRAEIRLDYARVLMGVQRYAEALAQLKLVTGEKPDNAQAWLIRGTLEQQERQHAAAEQSLRRFVELDATAADAPEAGDSKRRLTQAYLALAELAEQRKDYSGAQDWLDRIGDSQDMLSVQSRRAAILARQGKLDEARALIRATPEKEPGDARMKVSAELQLLRDGKQYRLAYELLRDAILRYPKDVDLVYDQAMVAEKLGDVGEMERLLRQAIAAKPDFHHAYNALGYSLADRNLRLAEARQLVQKALEFSPGDPFISDSLGWVEFRSGNLPEALRLLQQAFKARPDAEIAAHLGEVLWTMGDRKQALAVWKEGQGLSADNETLLETLKRLRVKL